MEVPFTNPKQMFANSVDRAKTHANSLAMAAEMLAAGAAEELGLKWHKMPPTDHPYIEIAQPVALPPPTDASVFGVEPHVWRLPVTTFNFGGKDLKAAGDRFMELLRQSLAAKACTKDIDDAVLVFCWRVQPEMTNDAGAYKAFCARLIADFMPRSFLAETPNNGVTGLYMRARCQGKSELGKLFREARESMREMTGIKPSVIMESKPSGPNWWGEYYKKAFAEHIAIDEAAEFDWDAVAKARTEAMIRGGREILEKRAAEIFAGIHTMPDGTKITREEMQDHGTPTPYIATHGTEYLGIDPARPDVNDVNVFKDGVRVADHLVDASAWFWKRSPAGLKESDFSEGDIPYSMRVKPPVNMNAYFDHKKKFAREERIKRNEMRPVPMDLTLPNVTKMIETTRREHNLCRAIDRVELPHETTIHDRLMPYRHKED